MRTSKSKQRLQRQEHHTSSPPNPTGKKTRLEEPLTRANMRSRSYPIKQLPNASRDFPFRRKHRPSGRFRFNPGMFICSLFVELDEREATSFLRRDCVSYCFLLYRTISQHDMQLAGDSSSLPRRSELPQLPNAPPGAAWVWGKDDEVCPHIFAVPCVVYLQQTWRFVAWKAKSADARTYCGCGKTHQRWTSSESEVLMQATRFCLVLIDSWSLRYDLPDPPVFGREPFKHTIKELAGGLGYDDLYSLNTQSGSQVGQSHSEIYTIINVTALSGTAIDMYAICSVHTRLRSLRHCRSPQNTTINLCSTTASHHMTSTIRQKWAWSLGRSME